MCASKIDLKRCSLVRAASNLCYSECQRAGKAVTYSSCLQVWILSYYFAEPFRWCRWWRWNSKACSLALTGRQSVARERHLDSILGLAARYDRLVKSNHLSYCFTGTTFAGLYFAGEPTTEVVAGSCLFFVGSSLMKLPSLQEGCICCAWPCYHLSRGQRAPEFDTASFLEKHLNLEVASWTASTQTRTYGRCHRRPQGPDFIGFEALSWSGTSPCAASSCWDCSGSTAIRSPARDVRSALAGSCQKYFRRSDRTLGHLGCRSLATGQSCVTKPSEVHSNGLLWYRWLCSWAET